MTATTPRERRRRQTTADILDAAWEQCREVGLAGLSLRDLAAAVGMRAPSLYSYFASKNDIYDAMFRQGYEQIGAEMGTFVAERPVTRQAIKEGTRRWFELCTGDPVRYQLLFQRTIPGFEPSPESYAVAVEYLDDLAEVFAAARIDHDGALDLWTAITTGLTSQQLANDPGGDRWGRLVDDAVDMFLDHLGVLPDN